MKRIIAILVLGLLLIGISVFADDGDFLIDGDVGIGTYSPTNKLHIRAGSGAGVDKTGSQENVVLESNTNAYMSILTPANTNLVGYSFATSDFNARGGMFYEPVNDKLKFRTNSTPRMVIDTNGNVGIGTTTPIQDLHIVRTGETSGSGLRLETTDDSDTVLSMKVNSGGTVQSWSFYVDGTNKDFSFSDLTGNKDPFVIENGALNNQLVLKEGGNVGIGTFTPREKL